MPQQSPSGDFSLWGVASGSNARRQSPQVDVHAAVQRMTSSTTYFPPPLAGAEMAMCPNQPSLRALPPSDEPGTSEPLPLRPLDFLPPPSAERTAPICDTTLGRLLACPDLSDAGTCRRTSVGRIGVRGVRRRLHRHPDRISRGSLSPPIRGARQHPRPSHLRRWRPNSSASADSLTAAFDSLAVAALPVPDSA